MKLEWVKPAIIIFVLVMVGINMLALGYIALSAQRDADEQQVECHQLEDLIKLMKERLPARP
jgi:hypothetical protein